MLLLATAFAAALTYGYGDPAMLALRLAARNGNMAALTSIVQSQGRDGLDLDLAFTEASSYGRINAMKFLIARGADDFGGALRKAALRNQIAAVRYLLKSGVGLHETDLWLARLAAETADAAETEFLLVTHMMMMRQ